LPYGPPVPGFRSRLREARFGGRRKVAPSGLQLQIAKAGVKQPAGRLERRRNHCWSTQSSDAGATPAPGYRCRIRGYSARKAASQPVGEQGTGVKIRSPSDFWCGVIFLAIGVAFAVLAQEYRFGTAARMGPGYFPTLLGGLLAVLGLSLSVPAFVFEGERFPRLHWRPLLAILAGIVAFALLLDPLGFLIAAAALLILGGFADPDLRPLESLGLAVFLIAFSTGLFVLLLGLPLHLLPNL
jgi:putative tricarboxylic transport membrane protein